MMKQSIYFLVIILSIFFAIEVVGQNIPRVGTPFVQQYKKTEYHAGNQNWGLAVSSDGIVYSANTEGLLSFDGQEWQIYATKNHAGLRSVNIDATGRIFVGGAGEFGYWTRSDFG